MIRFNVSHSRGILACAIARESDVGIDIEYRRPLSDYMGIARCFFSPTECRELMSIIEPMRDRCVLRLLGAKEAFVKALGGGVSIPLDGFQVSLGSGRAAALLAVRDAPGEERTWEIDAFSPTPDFSGALAVRGREKRVRIRHTDARKIFVNAGFL